MQNHCLDFKYNFNQAVLLPKRINDLHLDSEVLSLLR
jgi:hypothetical protein